MKVTVKTFLNVRVGKPSVNAPCYQYLAPGTELEVDGNLYPGDRVEGIDTWLKDEAENYYWSGGVNYAPETKVAPPVSDQYWWLNDYHIPYLHSLGLTGKGIKVAVLDTGVCINHPALNLQQSFIVDVTGSPSNIADNDGHGTHCVGIINANSPEFGLLGIAPNSTMHIGKITHDDYGDDNTYLAAGIKWAIDQCVDIISISNGFPIDNGKEVELLIAGAIQKGILFVCAAGNRIQGYPNNHIYYPARYPNVISVGGLDINRNPINSSILTRETKIFAPGNEILSTYKNNGYTRLTGSSQATPFVVGVCALILEHLRKTSPTYPAVQLSQLLFDQSDSFMNGKIINPLKLINKLTS